MCPFVAKDLSYVSNVFFRPGLRGGVRTGPARERGTQPPGRRLECLHLLRKSNKYVGRLPSHKDHVRFEGRDRGEDTAGLRMCPLDTTDNMSVGPMGGRIRLAFVCVRWIQRTICPLVRSGGGYGWPPYVYVCWLLRTICPLVRSGGGDGWPP